MREVGEEDGWRRSMLAIDLRADCRLQLSRTGEGRMRPLSATQASRDFKKCE